MTNFSCLPMRAFVYCLLLALMSPLAANDVVVPDGKGGLLMLLPDPMAAGGEGLSEFAGDPGLPAPAWQQWPGAAWPGCELWRFADGKFEQATKFLGGGKDADKTTHRRTLYAVFVVDGVAHVLQYDPSREFGGFSQVIRLGPKSIEAGGTPPADAFVVRSPQYLDAPAVSPDGKHVVLRAFGQSEGREAVTLRIYETSGWKLTAESNAGCYGRPVWIDSSTLAVVAYEGSATLAAAVQAHEREPRPVAGRLLKFVLGEGALTATELLSARFAPDFYSRNLVWSEAAKRLVVARALDKTISIEMRTAAPASEGEWLPLERIDFSRGLAVDGSNVLAAGVVGGRFRLAVIATDKPVEGGFDTRREMEGRFGTDGRSGIIGLDGRLAVIEATGNALYAHNSAMQPQVLHTLVVTGRHEYDSLRNPRALQRVSGVASRFKLIDDYRWRGRVARPLRSTVLAFDLDIAANNPAIKNPKGRYIEYFEASGRGGKGRIRVEDNFGGQWTVSSVHGNGTPEGDRVYDNSVVGPNGELNETAAERSGDYEKRLEQIDSRNALLLTGIERVQDRGGLRFVGRGLWRNPQDGTEKRVFTYARTIRTAGGGRYDALLSFVADMPFGVTQERNPHPLARALMQTRLGGGDFGVVDLAFDTDSFVELPNLEDKDAPRMLLPRRFSAYQPDAQGKPQRIFSAELLAGVSGDPKHLRAPLVCGYNEPGAAQDSKFKNLYR